MKKIVCVLLIVAILFSLAGCKKPIEATDLMNDIKPQPSATYIDDGSVMTENQMSFSLELFKACIKSEKDKNVLISPLSVYLALAMTANGAQGDTEREITGVLGASNDALNAYLKSYTENLPSSDAYKVKLANSIWFRNDENRLSVEQSFLQTNADYFGADIYKTEFNKAALRDINNWVQNNTDGMIDKIIDDIKPETVMCIINALVFDSQWQEVYEKDQVDNSVFTSYSGEIHRVSMMYSDEYGFLKSCNATGFKKNYKDGKYSFVAILPNQGEDIYSFIESGKIEEILNAQQAKGGIVHTGIPKFSYEYSVSMNDILSNMGMPTAFNSASADFSKMATSTRGNIYIGDVLHKTYIEVGEKGTKAGAVTKVEVEDEAAMETLGNTVILNRPFIYMIVDNESELPLFMGTVIDIGEKL